MNTVRNRNESGAALIEFALIAPLLILLVLGIVEFGWKFGQFNDVRHAVREGARFAAVDGGDEGAIVAQVCNAMDLVGAGITQVRVSLTDAPNEARGENGSIRVEVDVSGLTNAPLISSFVPGQLASEVSFRLEQDSSQWDTTTIPEVCP